MTGDDGRRRAEPSLSPPGRRGALLERADSGVVNRDENLPPVPSSSQTRKIDWPPAPPLVGEDASGDALFGAGLPTTGFDELVLAASSARPRRFSAEERRALRENSLLLPGDGESVALRQPRRVNPRMCVYERRSHLTSVSVSLARQRVENFRYIASLNGTVGTDDVFFDDDVSAKGGLYRHGMEMMLRQVQAGRYDGVVVWELPRALRNKRESMIFRDILMRAGCDLYVVRAPSLSLFGPTAILFDTLVDIAEAEIVSQQERARSYQQFMAGYGAAMNWPVFGMTRVPSQRRIPGRAAGILEFAPDLEPRPELGGQSRGELVRGAAAAVLSGESLPSIIRRWNNDGFPARLGGKWHAVTLKSVMSSPSLAGFPHRHGRLIDVDHNEVPLGGERSADVPQVNVPLIEPADWFAVREELSARRSRYRAGKRRTATESLLRGLLVCSYCGARLQSVGPSYACKSATFGGSDCPGNAVYRKCVEPLVVDAALAVLADPALRSSAEAANEPRRRQRIVELQSQADRVLAQLDRLLDLYLNEDGSEGAAKDRYASKRAVLEEQLRDVNAEIAVAHQKEQGRQSAALARAGNTRQAWDELPMHTKNSVLHELIDEVVIGPANPRGGRGGGVFNPDRVGIRWGRA